MTKKIVETGEVVYWSSRSRGFGKSQTMNTIGLIHLLKTNGINPEDALFYLGAYLQDQEVTKDEA